MLNPVGRYPLAESSFTSESLPHCQKITPFVRSIAASEGQRNVGICVSANVNMFAFAPAGWSMLYHGVYA